MVKSLLQMKFKFLPAFSLLLISSCSLNYGRDINSESSIPELSFSNANFRRIENGKEKIVMSAEKLEQYKADNASFAKNVQFKSFDSDGKTEAEGSCGLFSADTKEKKYGLYKDIKLHLDSQEMDIEAQALRYNAKTEQLTSERDSEVKIKNKDIQTSGRGFSASTMSNSYAFMYEVEGKVHTEQEKTEAQPEEKK